MHAGMIVTACVAWHVPAPRWSLAFGAVQSQEPPARATRRCGWLVARNHGCNGPKYWSVLPLQGDLQGCQESPKTAKARLTRALGARKQCQWHVPTCQTIRLQQPYPLLPTASFDLVTLKDGIRSALGTLGDQLEEARRFRRRL